MNCSYTGNSVLLSPLSHAFCPLLSQVQQKARLRYSAVVPTIFMFPGLFCSQRAGIAAALLLRVALYTPLLITDDCQLNTSGINAAWSGSSSAASARGCMIRSSPGVINQAIALHGARAAFALLLAWRLLRHAITACAASARFACSCGEALAAALKRQGGTLHGVQEPVRTRCCACLRGCCLLLLLLPACCYCQRTSSSTHRTICALRLPLRSASKHTRPVTLLANAEKQAA